MARERSAEPVRRHRDDRESQRGWSDSHRRKYGGDEERGRSAKASSSRHERDDDEDERRAHKRHREDGADRRPRDEYSRSKHDRETSRERAARKEQRRAAKEAAKREAEEHRLAAAEVSVYSVTDNPFHDSNLDQAFVWGKKKDKERKQGLTQEDAAKRDARRRQEAKEELEKLNRLRATREEEAELREAEAARMARLQESAQMEEWLNKEGEFQLEQARKRAEIRTKENRAKPIDFLALNLKWSQGREARLASRSKQSLLLDDDEEDEGAGLDIDLEEPYLIFENLTLDETRELENDIKMYLSLETTPSNIDFWKAMLVVCDDALATLESERQLGHAQYRTQQHTTVKSDIANMFRDKTYQQLAVLQGQIADKLGSGDPIDVEYWEGLLKELAVWMAKAKLRNMHEVVLKNRLEQLRRRQRDSALKAQAELANTIKPTAASKVAAAAVEKQDEYSPSMEPPLVHSLLEAEQNLELLDPREEIRKLIEARKLVVGAHFVPRKQRVVDDGPDRDEVAETLYRQHAESMYQQAASDDDMDEEEELFNMEAEISKHTYGWEDKYRPRKPRHFNKVITAFEWTRFNRAHYDTDNPPPKVVQGYKFAIFYPDLIDKTKTPTYLTVNEPGNEDTCMLVFKAGPPYEDLGFRIVKKDWEYSHKRGFKSTFDRGVLQLQFTLKKTFYRK
ncbi:uncharacterized protein L969DRAFT_94426 [Mixia osmundae IAM 14324]|uniref:Splicing factor Cactin n=1 Tax=Mixia osmundae (strain CBS 9802 / IAM 14324 / JCM 22182 / KY 12970) TaxID=764103 RepID=G7E3F9_MIXOS|nr:uncharacterized protein L969DRAFT_94426 [Mixia osmundae IAM 14324]KEI39355.1 hypothetical protein L969DRAFT_94426 [Mixia osmundae IAM 14324]GAA97369.1 hypothetical protein E5Q_04047 [Mixia osmundae IAM 14324]